jgi:Fic family protein
MGTPERAYSASHPWISYQLDLSRAGAEFWLLLGEARSKVEHLSLALLKPEVAEQMHRVYLAKGAQATTAIEGNTLSEDEVANIVAGVAAPPPPSQEYLYREVENIVSAFNRIKDHLVAGGDPRLTPEIIREFNRDVLEALDQEGVRPGEFRRHSVVVGPYRGAPWEDCEYLVERLCTWLESSDFDPPDEEWVIPYALLKAMVAHLYIAWIHPFDDGNGRTARLMELQILLAAGVPMPATHLLSNHYNATRTEYYRHLQEASESGGDVLPFLRYAMRGFVDGLRAQIQRVWVQQYADRWEQFVYETFGGRTTTETAQRRLRLVLELSGRDEPVARRDIPSLSLELGLAYVGTERML